MNPSVTVNKSATISSNDLIDYTKQIKSISSNQFQETLKRFQDFEKNKQSKWETKKKEIHTNEVNNTR